MEGVCACGDNGGIKGSMRALCLQPNISWSHMITLYTWCHGKMHSDTMLECNCSTDLLSDALKAAFYKGPVKMAAYDYHLRFVLGVCVRVRVCVCVCVCVYGMVVRWYQVDNSYLMKSTQSCSLQQDPSQHPGSSSANCPEQCEPQTWWELVWVAEREGEVDWAHAQVGKNPSCELTACQGMRGVPATAHKAIPFAFLNWEHFVMVLGAPQAKEVTSEAAFPCQTSEPPV